MKALVYRSSVAALDFDLAAEVKAFVKALDDHRFTIDVPAPTAHPLVEAIVRQHDGIFEIIEDPTPEAEEEAPAPRGIAFAVFIGLLNEAEAEALFTASRTVSKVGLWYDCAIAGNRVFLDDSIVSEILSDIGMDDGRRAEVLPGPK